MAGHRDALVVDRERVPLRHPARRRDRHRRRARARSRRRSRPRSAPLVPVGDLAGTLCEPAAAELGLRAGVRVVAAPGDVPSALMAVTDGEPGRAFLNLGTTIVATAALAVELPDGVSCEVLPDGRPRGGDRQRRGHGDGRVVRGVVRHDARSARRARRSCAARRGPGDGAGAARPVGERRRGRAAGHGARHRTGRARMRCAACGRRRRRRRRRGADVRHGSVARGRDRRGRCELARRSSPGSATRGRSRSRSPPAASSRPRGRRGSRPVTGERDARALRDRA